MDFYDNIAQSYDEITATAARQTGAEAFVDRLLADRDIASAVDVACGTGLYALALARQGVHVVGVDVSEALLAQAAAAADEQKLSVRWLNAPMQQLDEHLPGPEDLVLCMGNSLPHLLTPDELARTLRAFRRVLGPNGLLAVHLLNYERILEAGERIVGITRQGGVTFVRFYDFLDPERLRFNILQLTDAPDGVSHKLHGTTLRPWTAGQLAAACKRAGFEKVDCFDGLGREPLDTAESDTVLVLAE
jgi:ubiquinone/menaquinone biosynthesis C-methylase UbiE